MTQHFGGWIELLFLGAQPFVLKPRPLDMCGMHGVYSNIWQTLGNPNKIAQYCVVLSPWY
jgi:hypothetical protein